MLPVGVPSERPNQMRLLLSLFIALLLSTSARAGLSPVDLKPLQTDNVAGCPQGMTGSATYIMSQAITGTTSASIDLGLYSCFSFSVTATAGGQSIRVWQSNSSTTYTAGTSNTAGTVFGTALPGGPNAQAVYSLTKQGGRYVWFDIPGLSPNLPGPNYVTPTASKYSIWYYLPTSSGIVASVALPASLTVTAYQGGSPWGVDARGSSVNASGFNSLSFTVLTGLTPTADTPMSLTWASSTTTGPVFYDLNCTGMTGVYFIATNSATAPAGWTSNFWVAGYQPCGQISQVPLEFNAADNTVLHTIGVGLSATSGTLGIVTKKRP